MKNSYALLILVLLYGCSGKPPRQSFQYNGYTQGTTFHITYDQGSAGNLRPEIDRLFAEIEHSLSLYDSASIISRVNTGDSLVAADRHFINVFEASKKVHAETGGAFDPAIYPLVKFWGFGLDKYNDPSMADSAQVDSLKKLVRFRDINLVQEGNKTWVKKNDPDLQLDFSAIIQGYTVDQVAALMENKGIANYMIEVGGETRAKGKNTDDKTWEAGIDKPVEDPNTRELMAIARLDNSSMATSGSYRKFYVRDGMKYSLTIDPATGYPVSHTLVSATVFAGSCTDADAYATAFMVMGVDASRKFVAKHPDLSAYLIYTNYKGDWEVFISEGLKQNLEILKNNEELIHQD